MTVSANNVAVWMVTHLPADSSGNSFAFYGEREYGNQELLKESTFLTQAKTIEISIANAPAEGDRSYRDSCDGNELYCEHCVSELFLKDMSTYDSDVINEKMVHRLAAFRTS